MKKQLLILFVLLCSTALWAQALATIPLGYSHGDGTLSDSSNSQSVSITEDGTAEITESATDNYSEAQKTENITVSQAEQTITVVSSLTKTYGDAPFNLGATTNGDGILTYFSTDPLIVSVDDGLATIIASGTVFITITAAATDNYSEAQKTVTIIVSQAEQTITVVSPLTKTYGDAPFNLGATTDGDGTLSYSSSKESVVTVDENGLATIIGGGTAEITITAAAKDNYSEAQKTVTITVSQAEQTITVVSPLTKTYGDAPFNLGATTDGDGTLSYSSSKESVVTVDENGLATIIGGGTAEITITAAATDNYSEAQKTVNIEVQVIHSITYHLDGGENSDSNPTLYKEGSAITLADASKTNYLFVGWYTDEAFTGTALTEIPTDATEDYNLYARFETEVSPTKPSNNQISTLAELRWLSENSTAWDQDWVQTANIDASQTIGWNNGEGFSPIGNSTANFTGSYNGGGFEIDGLYINRTSDAYSALFGYVSGGSESNPIVIKNLGIGENSHIENRDDAFQIFAAGLVAYSNGVLTIEGCYNSGTVTSSYESSLSYGGGLVAYTSSVTISNSYNSGTVSSTAVASVARGGGLVAYASYSVTISNSYNSGTVSSSGDFSSYGGGLVARAYSSSTLSITNSYNSGTVTSSSSSSYGGGLVARASSSVAISNCYASGAINVSGNGTINEGGLAGVIDGSGTVTFSNCFYDKETTGMDDAAVNGAAYTNITGETTENMKALITYNTWLFLTDNTSDPNFEGWGINPSDNGGYPFLALQGYTHLDDVGIHRITYHLDGGENSESNPTLYNEGSAITLAAASKTYYIFDGWYTDAEFTGTALTEIPTDATEDYNLYARFETEVSPTEPSNNQISTLAELRWLSENSTAWDQDWVQTANIDASQTIGWNNGEGFSPIGNSTANFTGSYNGGGFEIDGLYINRTSDAYSALFGYVSGGTEANPIVIKNLGIGENSHIENRSDESEIFAAGIVACSDDVLTIEGCYNSGSVYSNEYSSFEEGLVARASSLTISKSYNSGTVNASGVHEKLSSVGIAANYHSSSAGGLVARSSSSLTISNSHNSGNVSSSGDNSSNGGGLVAVAWVSLTVNNSYNSGNVSSSGDNYSYGGGLVAYASSVAISNCYASGAINVSGNGTINEGGLAGVIDGSGTVTFSNCFYDKETTGMDDAAVNGAAYTNITGETTENMKALITYNTWLFLTDNTSDPDFEGWGINPDENNGYPFLALQGYTHLDDVGIHRITYHLDGGENSESNPTLYNEGSAITLAAASKTYYIFDGWYTDAEFTGTAITEIPTDATADYELYARFETEVSPTEPSNNQISTLAELRWLSENSTAWDQDWVQTANIDASQTIGWNNGEGFSPIGNSTANFTGSYNGGGFEIDGLYINRTSDAYSALFGYVSGGSESNPIVIKNLGIGENSSIENRYDSNDSYAAGLVAYSNGVLTIEGCYNRGTVSSSCEYYSTYGGGLVAYTSSSVTINNSYNSGTVSSSSDHSPSFGGGLVAYANPSSTLTINNSYNSGTVSSSFSINSTSTSSYGGGLVAYAYASVAISNCYASGAINCSAGNGTIYEGALAGEIYGDGTVTFSNCFYDKETTGMDDAAVNGAAYTNITGETTENMKALITYNTWLFLTDNTSDPDFEGWGINPDENNGYPFLALQGYTHLDDVGIHRITYHLDGGENSDSNPTLYAEGSAITLAAASKTYYIFDGWYTDAEFTGSALTEIPTDATTDYELYARFEAEVTLTEPTNNKISTLAELCWLSANSTAWDQDWEQTADIDASQTTNWNSGKGFSPIGNEDTNFTGSYNGGGFEIDGLHINRTSDKYSALFGYVSGGTEENPNVIKNLGIGENSSIENRYDSNDSYAAGIVAYNNGVLTIEGCYNSGTVSSSYGGGLVAYASSVTISNSYNSGTVSSSSSSSSYGGGLVAYASSVTISNSYNSGTVSSSSSSSSYGAGLVAYASYSVTISNSYNSGTVSSTAVASVASVARGGGLVAYASSLTISNSYNSGTVSSSGDYTSYGAGLVAYASSLTISNCYASGAINVSGNGTIYEGGLAGRITGSGTVTFTHCFYDKETTGMDDAAVNGAAYTNITGETTENMKALITYNTWLFLTDNTSDTDFEGWGINPDENNGYPFLALQGYTHQDDDGVHHMTYHLDGGENSDSNPTLYAEGSAITLADASKTYYIFDGWYTDAEFTGSALTEIPTDATADYTLYASFEVEVSPIAPSDNQISTLAELRWLSENSTAWDQDWVQTANIDASQTIGWNSGEGFSPIGNSTTNFTGSYDGGGFEINGLYINRTSDEYSALFGYVSGGTLANPIVIKNLGIGENSHFENRYDSNDSYAAGIVAYSNGVLTIVDCYNSGTVFSSSSSPNNSYGAGLVAFSSSSSLTINNSYNSGTVTSSSSFSSSFSYSYGGGLVAYAYASSSVAIINSYNSGTVSSSSFHSYGGGLVANVNTSLTINNSYNSGTISSSSSYSYSYGGGLVGKASSSVAISNCYASGAMNVSGNGTIYEGALVGEIYGSGTVTFTHCFYDKETTGMGDAAVNGAAYTNITGETTENMKALITYNTWLFLTNNTSDTDFEGWGINSNDNGGYPFLAWQGYTHQDDDGVHHITYQLDGGENSESNPTLYEEGSAITLADATKTGYIFLGWYTDAAFTGSALTEIPTDAIADYNLYARFETEVSPTEPSYNQISTLAELRWLSENSTVWDQDWVQTANIDASQTIVWNSGEGFSPIGNGSTNFTGSYDGGGYEIDGLYINRTSDAYSALFGDVSGGSESNPIVIKNLGIGENSHIENRYSSDNFAAGIVARNEDYLTIDNCYNSGTVNVDAFGTAFSGGLVAYSNGHINITHSYNSGSINADSETFNSFGGGLVGLPSSSLIITNAYNSGSVTAYSASSNTSANVYGGGLVGSADSDLTITNAYNSGSVTASSTSVPVYGGGLMGYDKNSSKALTIENSFYNIGVVSNYPTIGDQSGEYTDCGITTTEMQTQSTYTDWDFMEEITNGTEDIWGINPTVNGGYPFLAWQGYTHAGDDNTYNIWIGGTAASENNWNTDANWSKTTVPVATDDVLISSSEYVPVIAADTYAQCNNLTIDTNASLTITSGDSNSGSLQINGTVSGEGAANVSYERHMGSTNFQLVSTPLQGQGIGDFYTNNIANIKNNGSTIAIAPYCNNEETPDWKFYTTDEGTNKASEAGSFVMGQGYEMLARGNDDASGSEESFATLTFTGTPYTGNVDFAVSDGETIGNGWNLIGNPYTTALCVNVQGDDDASENSLLNINSNNLDGDHCAIYVWDNTAEGGGAYIAVNESYEGTFCVAPGQAFFICDKADNTSISFTTAMRTGDVSLDFKSATTLQSELKLVVSDGSTSLSSRIVLNDNCSDGMDRGWDAGRMSLSNKSLMVYTQLANQESDLELGIQAISALSNETIIPIGITAAAGSEFTIGIEQQNIAAGTQLILEDRELGIFTDLSSTDVQPCISTVSTDISGFGRYYLHINKSATSIDQVQQNITAIPFYNEEVIRINGLLEASNATISLVSMQGQILKQQQSTQDHTIDMANMHHGIYIVIVENQGTRKVTKVMWK